MSLEQAIAELNTTIRELKAAIERNGTSITAVNQATQPAAAPAPAPAPYVAPAPAPAPYVAPAPAPATTQPAPTETRTFTPSAPPPSAPGEMAFAEAQQRLAAVAQRLGSPQRVIEVMQQYGGPPLTAVAAASYAQLVAQAEALQ